MRRSRRVKRIGLSPIEQMNELSKNKKGYIDLGQGEPIMKTPSNIINAAERSLRKGETHYTLSRGIIQLRKKIAEKLRKENKISANPGQIICTVGVSEAMASAVLSFIDKNDEVIVPTPSHPSFSNNVLFAGGKVVEVPSKKDFSLNIDEIEKNVNKKTKAIIINTPNNPSGKVYSYDELKRLAEIVDENDLLVISDEIYEKITYGKNHVSIGRFTDNAITISGFSKSYAMTGWRLGYLHAKEEFIESMLKTHNLLVICAPSFIQEAALAAFKTKIAGLKTYNKKRIYLTKKLNEIGFTCSLPEGAYYLFAEISKFKLDSFSLSKILLNKYNILTVPGIGFGKHWDSWVRFCYSFASMSELEKGIKKLKMFAESCRKQS